MDLWKFLKTKYPEDSKIISRRVNLRDIPIVVFDITDDGMRKMNEILDIANSCDYLKELVFTKSGGISTAFENFRPSVGVRETGSLVDVVIMDQSVARFQFRAKESEKKAVPISGTTAFKIFSDVCKKYGINLDNYSIENGLEIKKTIKPPLIELVKAKSGYMFNNAHHIDFHSAYMSNLIKIHSEFSPVVEELYAERKKNPYYKYVLTNTTGFFQSALINYKFSHLSKFMIEKTIENVLNLSKRLENSGRVVLSYNTDGIWYSGEPFHGNGEGKKIGEWENNRLYCKIYYKSAGCYAFEENGVFKPVVRGRRKLDGIKPRNLWTWKDFFNLDDEVFQYYLDKTKGKFGRIERKIFVED